jgi:hypothetical protein
MSEEVIHPVNGQTLRICPRCLKFAPASAELHTCNPSAYAREMEAKLDRYREALEKLARLGNEPRLGNSEGNCIAQKALGIDHVA